jgi:hypothetical protein
MRALKRPVSGTVSAPSASSSGGNMRLRTAAATVFATAILLGGAASTASAGEINGKGLPVGGEGLGAAHSNSICAFSGLEDGGDFPGQPAGPGAPPQNWGHSKEFFGATPAERKASGFQPGDSCNGHSGFLVNPPPEEP